MQLLIQKGYHDIRQLKVSDINHKLYATFHTVLYTMFINLNDVLIFANFMVDRTNTREASTK